MYEAMWLSVVLYISSVKRVNTDQLIQPNGSSCFRHMGIRLSVMSYWYVKLSYCVVCAYCCCISPTMAEATNRPINIE